MIHQSIKCVLVGIIICYLSTYTYADSAPSETQLKLQSIGNQIANTPSDQKLKAFQQQIPKLNNLAPHVPGLSLFNRAVSESYRSKMNTENLQNSFKEFERLGTQLNPVQASNLSSKFVHSLYDAQQSTPQTPEKIRHARNLLKKLIAQGISLNNLKKNLTHSEAKNYQEFLDKLLDKKLSETEDKDMNDQYEKDLKHAIDDFLTLIPPSASPGLSGPSKVFFRDLMIFNNEMWDASAQGLGLIENAIETGQIDTAQLTQISDRLNNLARKGPWSDSLKEFLDKLTNKIPGLSKLLKALWPEEKKAGGFCGAINCDCNNLEFGLLTRPYRQECHNAEKHAREQCIKSGGKVVVRCHATASGPNPSYPKE